VREAIIRLSNDYFVEIIPNRGAYIPHITLKDIVELYQLRMANDSMAAYLCAKNPPVGLVEQLKASAERIFAELDDLRQRLADTIAVRQGM